MFLVAAIMSVPFLVLIAIGFADRRWPARLSRRGSRWPGGAMDPFREPAPPAPPAPKQPHRATATRFHSLGLVVAAMALAIHPGCRWSGENPLQQLDEARSVAAELRVEFSKAADASNRAVMADTDETSIRYAREAEQTLRAVENDAAALAPLVRSLGYTKETQALEQFVARFSEYKKLDATILALAVENTNLKAQRLSFGPAREAAASFRSSLEGIVPELPEKERCRAQGLVAKALLAVTDIEVRAAPHIAEADDAAMTRMEQEMSSLKATANGALSDLALLVPANARAPVAAATESFARFDAVLAKILALSRRNSNVRSLDLALRSKPPLTAACDESLVTLASLLAQQGSKATR